MEDYRLDQSGQEVQNILDGAAMQSDLTAETERATEAEQTLQGNIDAEEERAKAAEKQNADDIDAIEEKIPSGASSSNKFATESDLNDASQTLQGNIDAEVLRAGQAEQVLDGKIDAEETRAKAAEKQNADDIDAIEEKIPSGASSENQLADKAFVNSSIATATATFRGTYNLVSDLHLTVSATEQQIAAALELAIATADNNDYCFIQVPTSEETPTEIKEIDRYKFNGEAWSFEYKLNNSGFTAAQWAAINSGITSGLVTKLNNLPTNEQLTTLLNGKQDTLTFDNVPTQGSNNPVKSGGVYSAIKDEETRAKAAEKVNADDIDAIEEKIPSGATSSNKLATASDVTGEATTRENADAALQQAIEAILLLIPSAATSLNKLADKAFVNSSISTATATFRGTFNMVNDLHLTLAATHAQIGTALASAISDEANNDYCFVQIPTVETAPNEIAQTDRYKFNGSTWEYEYTLNNSGFTSAQWTAINSGITQALVNKLSALPTNAELTTALGVLTSSITTINQKIPSAASQANQLVDTAAMEAYIVQVLDVLTASFNVTSSDGHVTVQISQVDGKITSVALTTLDIASAASLSLVEGRVTTAEGNISTNSADIAILQDAYAALTQSALVVVKPTDTWPVASPVTSTIYRVVDRVNTPPQYYSDYMWNGTAMVLMATYDNAIDDVPTAGSNNLVKSGGVYNELALGAVYDVSAKNPTAGPNNDGKWESLSALLSDANLSTLIPTSVRKGGMSIKFVQSSDNKYIQARCMAQNFTTDVTQWQGVDTKPTSGSKNLVESDGVANAICEVTGIYEYSENLIVYTLDRYVEVPYSAEIGETLQFTLGGTFQADIIRVYLNDTSTLILSSKGIITLTASVSISKFRILVRRCTTAGACYVKIEKLKTGTIIDIYNKLDRIYDGKFENTTTVNASTSAVIYDIPVNIKKGERFKTKLSLTATASEIRVYLNNNYLVLTELTLEADVYAPVDVTYIRVWGKYSVSGTVTTQLTFYSGNIELSKYISSIEPSIGISPVEGSISFAATGKVKALDINVKAGTRVQVKVDTSKTFSRFIIGFNNANAPVLMTNYYNSNHAEVSFIPDIDLTSLILWLFSADDAEMVVDYEFCSGIFAEESEDESRLAVMPSTVYALGGMENSIYHLNYLKCKPCDFFVKGGGGWKYQDRYFRNNNPSGNLAFQLIDGKSYKIIESIDVPTIVGDASVNTAKKVNIIGDSFTYNGTWFQHIADNVDGLTFVGMRHSYNVDNDMRAEGRGGWTLASYFEPVHASTLKTFSPFVQVSGYTYYGIIDFWKEVKAGTAAYSYMTDGYDDYKSWFDANGYKANPSLNDLMYDATNSKYVYYNGSSWVDFDGTPTFEFDYAKYIATWNIPSPDLVIVMLGKNDFNNGVTDNNLTGFGYRLNILINSVRSYAQGVSKTINIGICTPTVADEAPNNSDNISAESGASNMWQVRTYMIDNFDTQTYKENGVYVVDSGICLDPLFGFNLEEVKPFTFYEGNERELKSTNGVHPSTAGYKQIGTCVAGWIQYIRSL